MQSVALYWSPPVNFWLNRQSSFFGVRTSRVLSHETMNCFTRNQTHWQHICNLRSPTDRCRDLSLLSSFPSHQPLGSSLQWSPAYWAERRSRYIIASAQKTISLNYQRLMHSKTSFAKNPYSPLISTTILQASLVSCILAAPPLILYLLVWRPSKRP